MKRLAVSLAAVLLVSAPLSWAQSAPVITGPNNSLTAAIWYLGNLNGGLSCCSGLVYQYWEETALTVNPNTSDPNPTVQWSTNSVGLSRLQIIPSQNGQNISATIFSIGHSDSLYDISVYVTVDGIQSAAFPVFINVPWTMYPSGPQQYCNGASCDCPAVGLQGETGYVTLTSYTTADMLGNALTRIDANETLRNAQFQNASWQNNGNPPQQSAWPVMSWTGPYTFPDFFYVCTDNPGAFVPAPTSYNTLGTTPMFTETQNLWIGSVNFGLGWCTQKGLVTLYVDHGSTSNVETPVSNQGDCN